MECIDLYTATSGGAWLLMTYDTVATLQHLQKDLGDLSSEAGGLLLIQDKKSTILCYVVKDILEPICRLSAKL